MTRISPANYLCFCGHTARHHDSDEEACRACPCPGFDADDARMKDLEDESKILRDDVRRGK